MSNSYRNVKVMLKYVLIRHLENEKIASVVTKLGN